MLLGGDELGRTQRGNNNAYCQDNEISWFDWELDDRAAAAARVHAPADRAARARIPVFRRAEFLDRRVAARLRRCPTAGGSGPTAAR